MPAAQTSGPTLQDAILEALAEGDDFAAAALLRIAFGTGDGSGGGTEDLPELLEELAEYFVSVNRPEDALAAAGKAVLLTPSGADGQRLLSRRCRIGEAMLSAGLVDEACAVYVAIAQEAPGQTWVHEAAGSDYIEAGEQELAFAWLTAGLELAVEDGDVECADRLRGLRHISMRALGKRPDPVERAAAALVGGDAVVLAAGDQDDDLSLVTTLELEGDRDTLALVETLRRIGAA
jgi:tetratricopeptide (TPR) repeat protein